MLSNSPQPWEKRGFVGFARFYKNNCVTDLPAWGKQKVLKVDVKHVDICRCKQNDLGLRMGFAPACTAKGVS